VETNNNSNTHASDRPTCFSETDSVKKPFVDPKLTHYETIHRITLVSSGGFSGSGSGTGAGGTFFG
jgi:hypothetical protein